MTLISRLVLAGPVLFVGLSMVLNPTGFLAAAKALMLALQAFGERFQAGQWPQPNLDAGFAASPRDTLSGVRFGGVCVSAAAFLYLFGSAATWAN